MKQLILASTSVYRQELLKRLGLPFKAQAPGVDEAPFQHNKAFKPRELAEHLSQLKAHALASPEAVVIGGDQLVDFQGKILGKPHTEAAAIAQLKAMAGHSHDLITSVCVASAEGDVMFTDITRLTLRKLTDDEIECYVLQDQPLDCAGSYKIEKLGITLMEKIETQDFTAIQGLPLIKLATVLREKGFKLP